jgi:hypothetical protein
MTAFEPASSHGVAFFPFWNNHTHTLCRLRLQSLSAQ